MRFIDKHAKAILVGAAFIGLSGLAWAQAAMTPAQTISHRQAELKALGAAFGPISRETRAPAPNLDTIKAQIPAIQKAAAGFPTWFPAGSGPEAGVPTAAKPEIWTNRASFDEKMKAFQTAAANLATAGAGTDAAAITAAAGAVGAACGGCHRDFRVQPPRPATPPAPPAS